MSLYSVALHGQGVVLLIDGNRELCGFYKTEYVWADTEEAAKHKAVTAVREKLNSAAAGGDVSGLKVEVESTAREKRLWKAVSSPGFAFYRDGQKQPAH